MCNLHNNVILVCQPLNYFYYTSLFVPLPIKHDDNDNLFTQQHILQWFWHPLVADTGNNP